jgi:hypothetical protein
MKLVRALIFLMYFIVYGYSCYMTSVEPERNLWGYICTFVFGILFAMIVLIFTKNQKNKSETKE